MKFIIGMLLAFMIIFTVGCSTVQEGNISDINKPITQTPYTPSEISALALNAQDIAQIGLVSGGDEQDLKVLELTNNNNYCRIEKYNTSEFSPLEQYSLCSYNITGLNNTQMIVEMKKLTNLHDLNGSYQYESSHLRSVKGILSQNDYGDQSKFYLNNEEDYGGEFTNKSISYYALYFTKGTYMVYVSSKGSRDAKEYVASTGRRILSKFD